MLGSRETETQRVLHMGRSTGGMMRSKSAVTIWEGESSVNRDIRVQISTLLYSRRQISKENLRKNGIKNIAESIIMPAHKSALCSCLE